MEGLVWTDSANGRILAADSEPSTNRLRKAADIHVKLCPANDQPGIHHGRGQSWGVG